LTYYSWLIVLTVVFVGIAGYFLSQNRTALTASQAASAVAECLKTQGSTAISFHTGLVKNRPGESRVPNVLGERFDALSADVREFSADEQMQLMDEYGVRFYRQAPQRAVVALGKSARGWRLAND
jgi:hypothetical protein